MWAKLEVISQIVQISSVFVGILLIWWQIRTQNKLTSAQLYVSLEERFNDQNHRSMRRQTAQSVLKFVNGGDAKDLPGNVPLFSLLESCGELCLQKVMDDQVINAGFGYYAYSYVYLVMHGRADVNFFSLERRNQEKAWEGMEHIYKFYYAKNRLFLLDHGSRLEIAHEAMRTELRAGNQNNDNWSPARAGGTN